MWAAAAITSSAAAAALRRSPLVQHVLRHAALARPCRGAYSRARSSLAAAPHTPLDLRLGVDVPLTLREVSVAAPPGAPPLALLFPDVDAVMDAYIAAGQDDRDPYWCEAWASSLWLAQEVLARPELVAGRRVAELGCGLGLAGVAAALAGAAQVVFLDREGLALALALANAQLNGAPPPSAAAAAEAAALAARLPAGQAAAAAARLTAPRRSAAALAAQRFDWAAPADLAGGPADVLLASDILYESHSVGPVAACLPRLVSPSDGRVLLADPTNRAAANREAALALLRARAGVSVEWARARDVRDGDGAPVAVTMVALRRGCDSDTVGFKFRADE